MKRLLPRLGVLLATLSVGLLLSPRQPSLNIYPLTSRSHHISEITLSHKGCYGPCPVYDVTLRSDGTATFLGHRNVDRLGSYHARDHQFDFDRLVEWLESQEFFDLDERYADTKMDAEVVTTTAVRDSKRKVVTTWNSSEPPTKLWAINAVLGDVISNIEWEADGVSCK